MIFTPTAPTWTRTPLPIVPQDGDDPRELYASLLVKLIPLAEPVEGVLSEIEEAARTEGIPIVGRLEGSILQILTMLHGRRAMRILDIRTAIGYSAIWLAAALGPGGTVTTIELEPERAQRARRYIERAGFADRVEVLEGDAFDLIPTLGTYDLIFQDVMKHVYFGSDPELALSLLRLTVEPPTVNCVLTPRVVSGAGPGRGDLVARSRRVRAVFGPRPRRRCRGCRGAERPFLGCRRYGWSWAEFAPIRLPPTANAASYASASPAA